LKSGGLLLFTFTSCMGALQAQSAFLGSADLELTQIWSQEPNGWTYPVAVSLPSGDMPDAGFPVCILLHGNGGNGPGMFGLGNNITEGHILVAPTGYLNSWNLCGENSEAPDIAMLSDLLVQLSGFDNVNANRIRLVGFSNGAGLVNQAFIELDEPGVDAFVAFVSQMNAPQFHQGAFYRPSGATNAPLDFCGYDVAVEPLLGRKYISICNHNDSVVPYAGGPAVGTFFPPAEVSIYGVALQQGHNGPTVSGEALGNLTLFRYLDDQVVLIRGNAQHGTDDEQLVQVAGLLAVDEEPENSDEAECPEDLSLDGLVAVDDVLILLGEFGCMVNCGPADLNVDGWVGVADVLAMLNVFGFPCPEAPSLPTVYEVPTFGVEVQAGLVYAEGLSHTSLNSPEAEVMALLLDAYVPQGAGGARPAMVLIHGGGFIGGGRQQPAIVNLAQDFASRGWVVFSIDYRLAGDLGTVPEAWVDSVNSNPLADAGNVAQAMAIYPAHRDAKAALRWVVANADAYDLDLDYLTVGGGSAGAITAIGCSVTEPEDYQFELSLEEDPTLASANLGVTYEVQTILGFWGSKVSADLVEGIFGSQTFDASDPSLFIAHGTEDLSVLFSEALALETIFQDLGLDYALNALVGEGHGPWDASLQGQSLFALAFDFVVEQQMLPVE